MNSGISVVVCCFNSALRLPETIRHLANQKCNLPFEIIIVNNASTDDTSEIAKKEWGKYDCKNADFKIVEQPIPGLSNARKKGVECSKYDVIIFCDDDNWLGKEYIQIAFEIMRANPDIGALGGKSTATADIEFPEWWDDYREGYAVGQQAKKSGCINERRFVWGAGMVTRKRLYQACFPDNFKSLLIGRNGEDLSSGDDYEYSLRLLLLGYNLFYDDRLEFKHYISNNRLNWAYRKKMFGGHHKAQHTLNKYLKVLQHQKNKFLFKLTRLFKIVVRLLFKSRKVNKQELYNTLYLDWKLDFIPVESVYKEIIAFQKKGLSSLTA